MQIDIIGQGLALRVHAQDCLAPLQIGSFNRNLSVKTARTQQCGIKNVGTVCRRDEDQVRGVVKAVHLNQQLVEGLIAFIRTATITRTAVTTDRIDFIDEDNRGSNLLGAGYKITHTRSANTDIHLKEFRTCDREEGSFSFTRHCLRQQGLTRSRRTVEEHTSRNACTDLAELLGGNQELANFFKFLNGLVFTGHVSKGNVRALLVKVLGAALAKGTHHLGSAHAAHEEPEEPHDQRQGKDCGKS